MLRVLVVVALVLIGFYVLGHDGNRRSSEVWAIAHAEHHMQRGRLELRGMSVAKRVREVPEVWRVAGQGRRPNGKAEHWQVDVHILCHGVEAACARIEAVAK